MLFRALLSVPTLAVHLSDRDDRRFQQSTRGKLGHAIALIAFHARSQRVWTSGGGLLARARVAKPYQIGRSLGDGDYRSIRVAANDRRHDGCVDHSKTLDSENTKLRVHDPANPARARRVIEGLRV